MRGSASGLDRQAYIIPTLQLRTALKAENKDLKEQQKSQDLNGLRWAFTDSQCKGIEGKQNVAAQGLQQLL